MSQRARQPQFDYHGQIAQPEAAIKKPKSNRTKFIKDLNYKSNAIIRSQRINKLNENSRQKDYILKKQRSRKNSSIEMNSLLERMIPGAKIVKGEWKDHKLNGFVEIQYDNGNKFVGKYQNGVRVEGKMTYTQCNCEYEGSFFAQKFSGFGKLTYEGGRMIEGEWDNMQFVGNGTITYPNKDVYYGPVDQKLYKHGEGYLFLHNGYKYIGSFKHGSITGIGSYFKDEKLVIKGQWMKGKLIKQLSNGQESDGLEGLLNPQFDSKEEDLKQSTKQHFSYRFKESTEINYQPKDHNSVDSFPSSQSQSFTTMNHQQK